MDKSYSITSKQKNKHLSFNHVEFIVNRMIEFNALNKKAKRNIGKTAFINNLAITVNPVFDSLRNVKY